jgi:hypothetical protein
MFLQPQPSTMAGAGTMPAPNSTNFPGFIPNPQNPGYPYYWRAPPHPSVFVQLAAAPHPYWGRVQQPPSQQYWQHQQFMWQNRQDQHLCQEHLMDEALETEIDDAISEALVVDGAMELAKDEAVATKHHQEYDNSSVPKAHMPCD